MIGERAYTIHIAPRSEELERADPDVTCGDPGQNGAWQEHLPDDGLTGQHGGQRARGRDPERRHGFADHILPQYGPKRGSAISSPRERGWPRSLQLDVATEAVLSDHFPEQDRAPVTELWHEVAELMPGVSHGGRLGTLRQPVTGENLNAFRAREPLGVEVQVGRELPVQLDEFRGADRCRRKPGEEPVWKPRVGIVESEMNRHQRYSSAHPQHFDSWRRDKNLAELTHPVPGSLRSRLMAE